MPPAPVYKHEAIYDRRKAKPDSGSEQPRPRGWSPGQEPRGMKLFLRPAPGETAVRPGRGAARRGRRAPLGLQPRRLCLRGAEGLRAPASAELFPRRRPALFSPDFLTLTPLFNPQSGVGKKLPVPKKKKFTSGVEISDKKLPLPTTRRPQPDTSVNFLLLNTYSPV